MWIKNRSCFVFRFRDSPGRPAITICIIGLYPGGLIESAKIAKGGLFSRSLEKGSFLKKTIAKIK
jgi:hypothetical protein